MTVTGKLPGKVACMVSIMLLAVSVLGDASRALAGGMGASMAPPARLDRFPAGSMSGPGMGPPFAGRGGPQGNSEPIELGLYDDAPLDLPGGSMPAGVEPQPSVWLFSEGLSPRRATGSGAARGYVNYANEWVILPDYEVAGNFKSGIARVRSWANQPAHYIDFRGERVDEELVAQIQTGLVRVDRNGKWGFLDPRMGEMAVEARYDYAWDFSEGLACVMLRSETPQYRWIDYTGKEAIVLAEVRQGGSFHEGLAPVAAVVTSSGADAGRVRYGFIDRTGKFAIEPQFDAVYQFSEGRAMVRVGRKVGYIDLAGKLVVPAEYFIGTAFSEGLAAVYLVPEDPPARRLPANELGGYWGFIDPNGKVVIPHQYIRATPFSHGVSMVWYLTSPDIAPNGPGGEAEEWFGYIDHAGNRVSDTPRYRQATR